MPYENQSRLIAKIVRELLQVEAFDTFADLKEATKIRLGQLRIRCTYAELETAFAVIESNRSLTTRLPLLPTRRYVQPDGPPPPNGVEARTIYNGLLRRYADEHPRPAPSGPANFPALVEVKRWR